MATKKTIVGGIDDEVLAFTAGKDVLLDAALIEADCIGTAAHVTMLARLPGRPPVMTRRDCARVIQALVGILREARRGRFRIGIRDQDVHLAVERVLTARLGALGRRVHTARSRNDQVAVDLRLFGKTEILGTIDDAAALAEALLRFARRHRLVPMVGRTHLQPAMPSSVGVWASSYVEGLLDDLEGLQSAYRVNDRCPLGSAAGYGVPLPIDRRLTARLLGFREPIHNVLYAVGARGKCESVVLFALAQLMLTLSRLAEDLILFTMPEFGYFRLPAELCTGSSIMPQKKNPDVPELVRAKAGRVLGDAVAAAVALKALPGGYNRDLQETKEPFMEGLRTTRASLRIMSRMAGALTVNRAALLAGFTPDVFAADRALELVAGGMPFRDAYHHVRAHLDELRGTDPRQAVARKTHLGAPAGLDLALLGRRMRAAKSGAGRERRRYHAAVSKLLGVGYPALD